MFLSDFGLQEPLKNLASGYELLYFADVRASVVHIFFVSKATHALFQALDSVCVSSSGQKLHDKMKLLTHGGCANLIRPTQYDSEPALSTLFPVFVEVDKQRK